MSTLQLVLDFKVYEENKFWEYADLRRAFVTADRDQFRPITGKFESSQVIDLLADFGDLNDLIVLAHSEVGIDDLVDVQFDITDTQGTPQSTQFNSPYLVLMGMNSADYGTLTVTTANATSSDPIYVKIFRLGS